MKEDSGSAAVKLRRQITLGVAIRMRKISATSKKKKKLSKIRSLDNLIVTDMTLVKALAFSL